MERGRDRTERHNVPTTFGLLAVTLLHAASRPTRSFRNEWARPVSTTRQTEEALARVHLITPTRPYDARLPPAKRACYENSGPVDASVPAVWDTYVGVSVRCR